MSAWPAGEHLAEIYDALYASLAHVALRASDNSFAVRLHEASRGFGRLALELRGDREVIADRVVSALLSDSLGPDETGALTLYGLCAVVGPRLLVSLRDYLQEETDENRRCLMIHGSDLVVGEILAVGRTLSGARARDDQQWAHVARDLSDALDAVGMSESLGHRT